MYKVEIIIKGESDVTKALDFLTKGLIEQSLPLVSQTLNDKFKQNIRNEVDASGRRFKDLSKETRNKKGRGGASAKILQDNGFLIGGMFYRLQEQSVLFYNTENYAIYHQEGKGKLPKRTIYPEQGEKYVIDLIMRVFDHQIKKNM